MLPVLHKILDTPADVRTLWSEDPGTRRTFLVLKLFAAAFAMHLAFSWPERFGAAAYTTIYELGGGPVWSLIWAGVALSMFASRFLGLRAAYWALQLGGAAHLTWAAAVGWAAFRNSAPAFVGPLLFLTLGVLHVSTALEHREQVIGGAKT